MDKCSEGQVVEIFEKQRAWEEKNRVAEEKKALRETLEKEWRADLQTYNEEVVPAWQAECATIDAAWANQSKKRGRKPSYPWGPRAGPVMAIVGPVRPLGLIGLD